MKELFSGEFDNTQFNDRHFCMDETNAIYEMIVDMDSQISRKDNYGRTSAYHTLYGGDWDMLKGKVSEGVFEGSNAMIAYNLRNGIAISCIESNDFFTKGNKFFVVDGKRVKKPYAVMLRDDVVEIGKRGDEGLINANEIVKTVTEKTDYLLPMNNTFVNIIQSNIEEKRDGMIKA